MKQGLTAGAGLMCLLLAGCGDAGGGMTPTPPPPAPPFPAQASASYSAITATAAWQGVINPGQFSNTGPGSVTPATIAAQSSANTIAYDSSSQSYTVSSGIGSATFAPADKTATTDYTAAFTHGNDSLTLYGNAISGNTATPPVALSYTSFAFWTHTDPSVSKTVLTWYLFGQPTTVSTMPKTGTASYAGTLSGYWLSYGLGTAYGGPIAGTATLDANFATNAISTTLTYDIQTNTPTTKTMTGTITGATFAGSFASSTATSTSDGTFTGGFFGPSAAEAGYTFQIHNHIIDPYAGASVPDSSDASITGVVVAKKQ